MNETAARIKAQNVTVEVQSLDVQNGRPLVTEDFEIPSEVDEFWTRLRTRVMPTLKKHPGVVVEARLSEPPEVRSRIEQQARAELVKAGADEKTTSVTVLSAYKQGYSWLYDVVRPALAGKAVDEITIKFAELGPPAGWTQQGLWERMNDALRPKVRLALKKTPAPALRSSTVKASRAGNSRR